MTWQGYYWKHGKRRPIVSEGKRTVGALYKPSCGRCDALPWTLCDCSFQWAKDGMSAPPCNSTADATQMHGECNADLFNQEADARLDRLLALGEA